MNTNLKKEIITKLWGELLFLSREREILERAVSEVMDDKLTISLDIGDVHEIAHNNGREFTDETALKILRKIEAKKDMWKETLEDILWDEIEDTPPDEEEDE